MAKGWQTHGGGKACGWHKVDRSRSWQCPTKPAGVPGGCGGSQRRIRACHTGRVRQPSHLRCQNRAPQTHLRELVAQSRHGRLGSVSKPRPHGASYPKLSDALKQITLTEISKPVLPRPRKRFLDAQIKRAALPLRQRHRVRQRQISIEHGLHLLAKLGPQHHGV